MSKSRYGIVVLSKYFFNKKWPQWELDGLVQLENNSKNKIILPIWYKITKDEVLSFSAPLADKKAILVRKGFRHTVSELLKVIKPEGSTLLFARDRVIELGLEPPVITDDWWLDSAEFSGTDYYSERWGFPLPLGGKSPSERGERLAWAALQMLWQDGVQDAELSQISHPTQVLEFIRSQPGLSIVCHKFPELLAAYAPQLTIRGFGDEFEGDFENCYKQSVLKRVKEYHEGNVGGTALTNNQLPPLCDEVWALRDSTFGNYEPSFITCNYVQGELMGPSVSVYEVIDYIVWFISSKSSWIPKKIHRYLLDGFKNWPVWIWYDNKSTNSDEIALSKSSGTLFHKMYRAKSSDKFKLTKNCKNDIKTRFDYTVKLFGLKETAEILADKFIEEGFIEAYLTERLSNSKK